METDKLLYHFQKESDFLANQINLPNTGIAFVKDSQTIYTHGKEYNFLNWGELKEEYEAVDLGLPSGLLWANKNIGAETEEDAGLYFQWGDTQGYTAEQVGVDKQFTWDDYKWGEYPNFTKYNNRDNLTVLESIDDAATQLMGSNWRMPTRANFQELISNTDIYFISTDGSEVQATYTGGTYSRFEYPKAESMKGVKFYNRIDHTKYILFLSHGKGYGNSLDYSDYAGYFWSSELSEGPSACGLTFKVNNGSPMNSGYIDNGLDRFGGVPIRAVKSPTN